jgi:hypothetical protein
MIKEDKVLVKINLRNSTHYKKYGYDILQKELLVNIEELTKSSESRVTAICEICSSENNITYGKYNVNRNRNNKGYYSCFKCKNIEKEKTCIKKYGVKSYSMTSEFKELDNIKWKWIGIQKGEEKAKLTMLEKYGVDSYFKTDESRYNNKKWMSSNEFREKSKKTCIEKYGVESYSKTLQFKNDISINKDLILLKIKDTLMIKYGVNWVSKINFVKLKKIENKENIDNLRISTCIERYGVDNVIKVKDIKDKRKNTMISNGLVIPDNLLDEWQLYKRKVKSVTRTNKKILYENWDGTDYYDSELIRGYLSYTHTHRFYPTIDHKISLYFGFNNGIDPNEIGSLENLCITKRFINSAKGKLIETNFNI